MTFFKKSLLAVLFITIVQSVLGQLPLPVEQLQDYCKRSTPTGYSPKLNVLTLMPKGNLHYLFPLYHAFKDEVKFKGIYTEKGYYDEMSQYFAFAGDYQTAMQYLEQSYDSIDDGARRKVFRMVEGLKNVEHVEAWKYIHFAARSSRVMMINEAHDKPLQSAFVLSLLKDLYKEGYRLLAMEMLNNFSDHELTRLRLHTGYYTAEPVLGELVREALAIGYKLVSYEDTVAGHKPNQRDSIQAANLYHVLQEDTVSRMLVLASFTHISEKEREDGFIPMALAFKKMSGIDPLTIDQTDMTEESNFGYGRVLYQAYLQKFSIRSPSIAMVNNAPINVIHGDLYDLSVIHPSTSYQDGRPTWLSLGGLRQPVPIKPSSPAVFFVQAYYQDEIAENKNKPWQLVPADQTYIPGGKKLYLLYLKKGKYDVYFRDINYHILSTLNIEVN
ncbi:MAG TPA: hypothetical protein VHD83_20840 [Puia sp.]|nr:hypothetical protein [Puia sp.]